jgi:hypothetical protein
MMITRAVPSQDNPSLLLNADCGEMNFQKRGAPQLMSAESVHLSANATYQLGGEAGGPALRGKVRMPGLARVEN